MSNVISYRTFFNRREAAKDAGVMTSQVDLAQCASQLQDAVDKLYERFVLAAPNQSFVNPHLTIYFHSPRFSGRILIRKREVSWYE